MVRDGDWMSWYYMFVSLLVFASAAGAAADGNVTLESLTIFNTHEWFNQKPDVYFRCTGEEKVYLPDVVEKDHNYPFIGEESWQPLTTFLGVKCKRCGLYEEDKLKYDDTFDEWELCPTEFSLEPEGRYVRFKEKEFNLTLVCQHCNPRQEEDVPDNSDSQDSGPEDSPSERRGSRVGVTVAVSVFVVLSLGGLAFVAYSQWRRKQREAQQARFVQLFEEDDDLEAELGLKEYL